MSNPFSFARTSKRPEVQEALRLLTSRAVYVGIPGKAPEDIRQDGRPPNHILGYIHEYGSPSANIPPRPFLHPGVKRAQPEIDAGYKAAFRAALDGNVKAMDDLLERMGIKTVSAVKLYMATAPFEPLKPSTIANRYRSRLTKGRRQEEVDKDASLIRPLINTGSLRDAIQHLIRVEK